MSETSNAVLRTPRPHGITRQFERDQEAENQIQGNGTVRTVESIRRHSVITIRNVIARIVNVNASSAMVQIDPMEGMQARAPVLPLPRVTIQRDEDTITTFKLWRRT